MFFLDLGILLYLKPCRRRAGMAFFNFLCTMDSYKELLHLVTSLEDDFDKFYNKDNRAAGARLRKGMQTLKTMAHDLRKEIQYRKNNFPSTRFSKGGTKEEEL